MESNPARGWKGEALPLVGWVERLLKMQGIRAPERTRAWWAWHLQEFLRYCCRRAERADAEALVEGFLETLAKSEPPAAPYRIDQSRQALTVFLRGIEGWRWEDEANGLRPRFRLKAPFRADEEMESKRARICDDDVTKAESDLDDEGRIARMVRALRVHHYSLNTERAYLSWVERFLQENAGVPRWQLAEKHVRRFLENLAIERHVTASTQNQALAALLLFFEAVLGRQLEQLGDTVRATRGRRLPVVLAREQVERLLNATDGTTGLMLRLVYGTGMRAMDCIRLRVKDVDFERDTVFIRSGKGAEWSCCPRA